MSAAAFPAGTGIVYFGNDWFAENRTSSHHMARRLAAQLPLLYVDSPGMRAPSATGRDLRRLWRKLSQALRPASEVSPGLWHCTVPQLPWGGLPGVGWLNQRFGGWAVRRAMRRAGMRQAVLWFVVPHPSFMLDVVPHALAVYYCIDDYAAHPGVDVARIEACDAQLTRRADHVFVAPPALLPAKQAANPHTSYAPHGVDVALFARAQDPATPVPAAAAALARPVVGYFGLIADWTDIELLAWLAEQRPHWTLLLVGHVKTDASLLARYPNVVLAGAQPYEALPGWAKAFDVAVIPYRQNRQVHNANPLKLREYLATGKPVVAVPTAEINKFAHLVCVAPDRAAFLAGVEAALCHDLPEARAARMAAVQDMGWDQRAAQSLALAGAAWTRRHGQP